MRKAQPFDEQPGTGQLQDREAVLDTAPGHRAITPARRDEPAVLGRPGASWEDAGERNPEQPRPDTDSVRAARDVVEVEHIEPKRDAVP